MATEYATILMRRGSADYWAGSTRPLSSAEWGYDETTRVTKIGDGFSLWADLPEHLTADSDGQLTDSVRSTLASNLADPTTPEGAAVAASGGGSGAAIAELSADVRDRRGIRQGPSTVFLGDSITQNLNTLADSGQPLLGEGWATLAAMQSRQRILYLRNSGVTNDTVQEMAARLYADVITYKPAHCIILAGTNNTNLIGSDPNIGPSMVVYEEKIVRPLLAAGIDPIICSIPPRSGTRTTDSATYRRTGIWNTFLRSLAARYRLTFIDVYAALADPTTGDYKAGLSGDGVHPNKLGMQSLANTVIAKLATVYPDPLIPLIQDQNDLNNMAPNGLFGRGLQQGGSYPGLPVGWSGSSTGITTAIVDPTAGDGLGAGKWFEMKKTDTGTSKNVNWIQTFSNLATLGMAVATGDRIGWGFAYRIADSGTVTTGQYVTVALRYTDASGANMKIITPMNQFEMDGSGVVWFEATVPAGADRVRFDLSFSAASTQRVRLGQMTTLDLTTLGLPSLLADADTVFDPGQIVVPGIIDKPTTLTSDSFNRADTTPGTLGSTNAAFGGTAGLAWSATTQMQVIGNQVGAATLSTSRHSTVDVGVTNMRVRAKLAATTEGGVVARAESSAQTPDCFVLRGSATGQLFVDDLTGGSSTTLLTLPAGTVVAGDTIELRAIGSTLSVYVNGSKAGETSSSAHATATRAGLRSSFSNAASRLDDFYVLSGNG